MISKTRNVSLDVLMAIWGLGTWLGVNGMYVQLPLLVERLPEQWALPASMALVIQMANIGPLAYAALRRFRPATKDAPCIIVLLIIGALALFLNSGLYNQTSPIGNNERSVAFLTFTFFAALVGCTSSVLFYPYLRHFRELYLSTYLVGEGLSGFIPSILALIQDVGGEPECVPGDNGSIWPVYPPAKFSITVFMVILGLLSVASLVSFIALDKLKIFSKERIIRSPETNDNIEELVKQTSQKETTIEQVKRDKEDIVYKDEEINKISMLEPKWLALLILGAVLNALSNGVLPSVQSYSCMPYGTSAYHLAVTLGAMANPAACLAGVWLKPVSTSVLVAMLSTAAVPFGYIMATALMSPTPPLQNQGIGVALVVISWVAVHGIVSYARMWSYSKARDGGASAMRALGGATQIGSAIGSLLLFALVNYTMVFTQPDVCPVPV